MKQLRVFSTFDGISCGRIALERAGIPVAEYYASEINKDSIAITQYHYPDTIQLGDITKINGITWGVVLIYLLVEVLAQVFS